MKKHLASYVLGVVTALTLVFALDATAFDLAKFGDLGKVVSGSVKSLVGIKKNLDSDVKLLTGDAKTLIGDKAKLLAIKDELFKLATQTKAQIDMITKLVAEVEGHIKKTQGDIQTTSEHVEEIDKVRSSLAGAK